MPRPVPPFALPPPDLLRPPPSELPPASHRATRTGCVGAAPPAGRAVRALLTLLAATALPAQRPVSTAADPARAFFAAADVAAIRVELAPEARQQLRERPREYVRATLHVGELVFAAAAVKLKGAAGSFREVDDRPGFTVHLGKFGGVARLHGLQRFHLNNGAQDETRLCEWLGAELFAAAGRPAPRATHARVSLDGVDLGLYVLREAYDAQFLRRAFGTTAGNLYDGGFCQDVDTPLEKDAGDGTDDHADLVRLAAACRADATGRARQLAALVDVDALLDFMALEQMLNHWDGYTRNANNYRIWLPRNGGAVLLPHGMDQLFQEPDASVLEHPPALLAGALLEDPAWRKRYRQRLQALLPSFAPARVLPQLEAAAARLQRELRAHDPDAARAHADACRALAERVAERHRQLEKQVEAPEPRPLALAPGRAMPLPAKLWVPAAATDGVELARRAHGGSPALHVDCGPTRAPSERARDGEVESGEPRHGSFRTHVLLPRGRYQLRGVARCSALVPPPADADGTLHGGVALRVDGEASERLSGDRAWQQLVREFTVDRFQRQVELACDVRAFRGKAWFRVDSLQLVRLPDGDANDGGPGR